MNRRTFLERTAKSLGTVGMSSMLSQLYSAPMFAQQANEYRALVCLFLDGGLDSNDLIIPMDARYNQYSSVRNNLAVPLASLNPLKSTSDKQSYGLHPLLPQTSALFNSGQAALVANVGTISKLVKKSDTNFVNEMPYCAFSHPASVGSWEGAQAATAASTGWAGRVADQLLSSTGTSKMPAVIATSGYSLMGQGLVTDQLTAASNSPSSADLINTLSSLQKYFLASENVSAFNDIQAFVAQRQSRALSMSQVITDAYAAGNVSTAFPSSILGQQLQIVAKLIAGRNTHTTKRQIFVVRLGGFDTHEAQVRSISDRFTDMDAAFVAFNAALKELGMYEDVTLFTCSEFGRSLVANGQNGTDHGWGGHQLVLGGGLKGGDLYGTFPELIPQGPDDTNNLGIWIPTTSMSQYLATMAQWLGVPTSQLNNIFPELPNFPAGPLPLLRT